MISCRGCSSRSSTLPLLKTLFFLFIVISLFSSPASAEQITFSTAEYGENLFDYSNGVLTNYDGVTYERGVNGVMVINDNRFLAFAIRGDRGNGKETFTSMDFSWDWTVEQNGSDYIFHATNNNNNFLWEQTWYFYHDQGTPMKIEHYLENNLGVPINDATMFYIITVDANDTLEYNKIIYPVSDYTTEPLHKTGNFDDIMAGVDFNDIFGFNFGDLINTGFNITEIYIGNFDFSGYPNQNVLAVGFTKGEGIFPSGYSVSIDPQIVAEPDTYAVYGQYDADFLDDQLYSAGWDGNDIDYYTEMTSTQYVALSTDDTTYAVTGSDAQADGYLYVNFSVPYVDSINWFHIEVIAIGNDADGWFMGAYDDVSDGWVTMNSTTAAGDVSLTYNVTGAEVATYSDITGTDATFSVSVWTSVKGASITNVDLISVTLNYEYDDTTKPTYSGVSTNASGNGKPCEFSITYNDNFALENDGQYIFATNNSGEWVNDSAVNFTSTPETISTIKTLNSTVGVTIGYRWYADDNNGNINNTPIYTKTIVDDFWDVNYTIANGLGDHGQNSKPAVFYNLFGDNKWHIINGYFEGHFSGYQWNGTGWEDNATVIDGLPDIGNDAAPNVFYNLFGDETWHLIASTYHGVWNGYRWNGAGWDSNSTVVSGLADEGDRTSFTIFQNLFGDDKWHIVGGVTEGTFFGYHWNGVAWESNATVASGLGDIGTRSSPFVIQDLFGNNEWHLISGNADGMYTGFKWNGSGWDSNDTVASGIMTYTNSIVYAFQNFFGDGEQFALTGKLDGTLYGYRSYFERPPDVTLPTYSNDAHDTTFFGESCSFSIDYDDYRALHPKGQYIFATNNTGVWVNESAVNFTNTPETISTIKTLNSTVGVTIGYRWYADDSTGNANNTPIYTLVTEKHVWEVSDAVKNGLIDIGSHSTPDVFYDLFGDGKWHMISGNETGNYIGSQWNGTGWESNVTVINGLTDVGDHLALDVFYDFFGDGKWHMISGNHSGDFGGSIWNGTGWESNATVINGLVGVVGTYSSPDVFHNFFGNDKWHMISGEGLGVFTGYRWNGTEWESNSTVRGGLSDIGSYSTPNVFYNVSGDSKWHLISGEGAGDFHGWQWDGSTWVSNATVIDGLGDVGTYSTPEVFYNLFGDSKWHLISGEGVGVFTGFNSTIELEAPPEGNAYYANVSETITFVDHIDMTKTIGDIVYYAIVSETITVTDSIDLTKTVDVTLPTYSSEGVNDTQASESCAFSITYDDNIALHTDGQYIFATNNTGVWVNESAVNFTSTPQTITTVKTLNSTLGITIGYRWYANDSAGNENNTPIYTFVTTIDTWVSNASVTSGLVDIGSRSTPDVFYNLFGDDKWHMIAGKYDGNFTGYQWNGTGWENNATVMNGLGDIGANSAPNIFYNLFDDSKWHLISGDGDGDFTGYHWNGTGWEGNASVINGLVNQGSYSKPNVFYNLFEDSKWHLISGENAGVFTGYHWNGAAWVDNASIISGLGDVGMYSVPEVFYNLFGNDKWHLIAGEFMGGSYGFLWNGTGWESNITATSGLIEYTASRPTPTVFYNLFGDSKWHLIRGNSDGNFDGYHSQYEIAAGPSYNNVSADETITITDSVFLNKTTYPLDYYVNVSDTITLSDGLVVTKTVASATYTTKVEDTITITDSVGITKTTAPILNKINISDTVDITDSVSIEKTTAGAIYTTNISDTITFTDSVSMSKTTTAINYSINVSDSITLTDSVVMNKTLAVIEYNISTPDTISVVDSVEITKITTGINYSINISDTVTISDSVSLTKVLSAINYTTNISEAITFTDSVSMNKTLALVGYDVSVEDTVSFTDSVSMNKTTTSINYSIDVSDTISVSDEVSITKVTTSINYSVNASDTITFTDSVSMNKTLTAINYTSNVSDTITYADSVALTKSTAGADYTTNVSDTITYTDSVIMDKTLAVIDYSVNTSDTITYNDDISIEKTTVSINYTSNVSDTITFTDSVSIEKTLAPINYSINTSDTITFIGSVSLSKTAAEAINYTVNISDTITITDNVSLTKTSAANNEVFSFTNAIIVPSTMIRDEPFIVLIDINDTDGTIVEAVVKINSINYTMSNIGNDTWSYVFAEPNYARRYYVTDFYAKDDFGAWNGTTSALYISATPVKRSGRGVTTPTPTPVPTPEIIPILYPDEPVIFIEVTDYLLNFLGDFIIPEDLFIFKIIFDPNEYIITETFHRDDTFSCIHSPSVTYGCIMDDNNIAVSVDVDTDKSFIRNEVLNDIIYDENSELYVDVKVFIINLMVGLQLMDTDINNPSSSFFTDNAEGKINGIRVLPMLLFAAIGGLILYTGRNVRNIKMTDITYSYYYLDNYLTTKAKTMKNKDTWRTWYNTWHDDLVTKAKETRKTLKFKYNHYRRYVRNYIWAFRIRKGL